MATMAAGIPPYLALAELVRELPPERAFASPTGPELRKLTPDVTAFCTQYGLLGLLLHGLLNVRLGPHMMSRTPRHWEYRPCLYDVEAQMFGEVSLNVRGGTEASVVNEREWYFYLPELSALDREDKPPLPGSRQFWEAYGEPFAEFVRNARWFANAIELVAKKGPRKLNEGDCRTLDKIGALQRLEWLMGAVTPGLQPVRGGVGQFWHSHSLLNHLTMQATQDLLGTHRIIRGKCGVMITTAHPRARFCSERCASVYRQRAYRKRKSVGPRALSHAKANLLSLRERRPPPLPGASVPGLDRRLAAQDRGGDRAARSPRELAEHPYAGVECPVERTIRLGA